MKNLSINQTAKLLGLSRQYVWMLVKTNKIKAERIGKFYIISAEEVYRYKNEKIKKQLFN